MVRCTRCKRLKTLTLFYKRKSSAHGHDTRCIACIKKLKHAYRTSEKGRNATKEYNTRTRERRRAWERERRKNPLVRKRLIKAVWRSKLKRNYGLTEVGYHELRRKQHNKCAICYRPFIRKKRAVHIDHCHKTGKVRGLLCGYCNTGLGHFFDNADLLKKAIIYLGGYK